MIESLAVVKPDTENDLQAIGWQHFDHEADLGLRCVAATREAVFEEMAAAMTAVVTNLDRVDPRERVEISCHAPADDLLLVDWLNALIYEMAVRKMLFGRFKVTLDGESLHGQAFGEPISVDRHQPAVEVKGATYTGLSFGRRDDGLWSAQCVVDV